MSFIALIKPVGAATWTEITLPYTITEPGNYQISAPWTEDHTQPESVTGDDFDTGLIIQASDVVVDGMNNLLTGDEDDIVILVASSCSNVLLENINESDGFFGLWAESVDNLTVQDSSFDFNIYDGLFGNYTSNFTVQDSTFGDNGYAIDLNFSRNLMVQHCMLSDNELGLFAQYSDNATVTDNVFIGNGLADGSWYGGVEFDDSNCTVTNNLFDDNYDAVMWCTEDDTINCVQTYSGNVFHDNAYTFYFDYESDYDQQQLFFYNNLVNDSNYVDPDTWDGWFPPTSYELFLNTALQSGTRIYSSGLLGGNYWATPDGTGYSELGTDANNNGFIDQPFDLFDDESVFDYLPYSLDFVAVEPGPITLPCIITQSGHYQISSPWTEDGSQVAVFQQGGRPFETGLIIAASDVVVDGANKLLSGDSGSAAVVVAANNSNVNLENIRVIHSILGVTVFNSTNVTVDNCLLTGNVLGFGAKYSGNFTVDHSTLSNAVVGGATRGCQNFTIQNSKVNSTILGIAVTRYDNQGNFTIQNCNISRSEVGVFAREASNFSVLNCNFSNDILGMITALCSNYTIQGCNFNNSLFGLLTEQSNGFAIKDCNLNSTLEGIGINLVGVGIASIPVPTIVSSILPTVSPQIPRAYPHDFSVQNCSIRNSIIALGAEDAFNFSIQNCAISNSTFGLLLSDVDNATVNGNTLSNNTLTDGMPFAFGLGVVDSNCTITNNVFLNNDDGLLWEAFDSSTNNTVVTSSNIFENNSYTFIIAYGLESTCTNQQLFFYNNLVNDSAYVDPFGYTAWDPSVLQSGLPSGVIHLNTDIQPGTRIYSSGSRIGGNYWTYCNGTTGYSQAGTDANHDGFVDTPFDLFGNATVYDNHPYSDGYIQTIAFTAGTGQSLAVNQVSSAVTVQLRDAFGPATSGVTVSLSSTSSTGRFYSNSAGTNQITSLTIPAGSSTGSFYYKDTTVGNSTITVSSQGITSISTQFTINAHATASNVVITPAVSTITAGESKTYSAMASDAFGNTWDVTSPSSWGINAGAGGSWSGNVYTSANAGTWQVTCTYGSSAYTALLTVNSQSTTPTSTSTPTPTATPTPTPTATPTPTPTPTSNSTILASAEDGSVVELTINGGNITAAQVTSAVIATDQSAATTTISFTLTGETGTTGFSNITIPKSTIPYGTTPVVYIDGQPAQDQGYTEDAQNYYVWFTAHFSTHQVEISFTGQPPQPLPAWVFVVVAVAIVAAAIAVLLVARQKRKGTNQPSTKQETPPS